MGWIKSILRECFRYKLSGIAMVTCLLFSMLASNYGILIYRNIINESADKENYQYRHSLSLNGHMESLNDLPSLPEDVKCNMKIPWVVIYDSSSNTSRIVDVIISSYEETWPLVSGTYADKSMLQAKERIIMIGRDNMEYAYQRGDEWFYQIFGEEYRVIGVLGSEYSDILDGKIVLYLDCLGEKAQECLQSIGKTSEYTITLESNATDVDKIYDTFIKDKYKVSKAAKLQNGEDYLDSAVPIRNEKEYCLVIYIFCFVCMAIVIRFWLSQRTHEMKICRAYGYSNGKIIQRLAYSLFAMLVVSTAGCFICVSILNFLLGDMVKEYHLFFSWEIILVYIGIFIVSFIVISARPVYRFIHYSVVEKM